MTSTGLTIRLTVFITSESLNNEIKIKAWTNAFGQHCMSRPKILLIILISLMINEHPHWEQFFENHTNICPVWASNPRYSTSYKTIALAATPQIKPNPSWNRFCHTLEKPSSELDIVIWKHKNNVTHLFIYDQTLNFPLSLCDGWRNCTQLDYPLCNNGVRLIKLQS